MKGAGSERRTRSGEQSLIISVHRREICHEFLEVVRAQRDSPRASYQNCFRRKHRGMIRLHAFDALFARVLFAECRHSGTYKGYPSESFREPYKSRTSHSLSRARR